LFYIVGDGALDVPQNGSCISLRKLYFAMQSYIAIAVIFVLRQELSEVVWSGALQNS